MDLPTFEDTKNRKLSQVLPNTNTQLNIKKRWNVFDDVSVIEGLASKYIGKYETNEERQLLYIVDLSQFTKDELKRQDIIHEIINTELDYANDLKMMIQLYQVQFEKLKLLDINEQVILFSNMVDLITLSEKFYNQLENRRKMDGGILKQIGDIFNQILDEFTIYHTYCSNYPSAIGLIKRKQSKKEFSDYLKICTFKCKGLDLASYLLKPVQRICKYPLLIREILKATPVEHPDHQHLSLAMGKVENIVKFVNEEQRNFENKQNQLSKIFNEIDLDENSLPYNPTREIICEGLLTKVSKSGMFTSGTSQRYIYLLTDYIIFAKPQKNKYQVAEIASIWQLAITDVTDNDRSKHLICFLLDGFKRNIFAASSDTEKQRWIDSVSKLMNRELEKLSIENNRRKSTISVSDGNLLSHIKSISVPESDTISEVNSEYESPVDYYANKSLLRTKVSNAKEEKYASLDGMTPLNHVLVNEEQEPEPSIHGSFASLADKVRESHHKYTKSMDENQHQRSSTYSGSCPSVKNNDGLSLNVSTDDSEMISTSRKTSHSSTDFFPTKKVLSVVTEPIGGSIRPNIPNQVSKNTKLGTTSLTAENLDLEIQENDDNEQEIEMNEIVSPINETKIDLIKKQFQTNSYTTEMLIHKQSGHDSTGNRQINLQDLSKESLVKKRLAELKEKESNNQSTSPKLGKRNEFSQSLPGSFSSNRNRVTETSIKPKP
ncbi:hypothetical protein BC833DRAFT_606140 [Globomyces pollinis-pini]|nr:hypothetical protein BC833DRAFT_606140 [Globomyces pollinis-pini]